MISPVAAVRPLTTSPFDGATTPYFENHPIGHVWLAVLIATGLIELAGAGRRRQEATRRDRGSQVVLRVCAIPGALLLVSSPRIASVADIRPPVVAPIVGIVILAAGESLRVWAKSTLGRYFTYSVQTSAGQPVITTGPYRWVRHPSYTGTLLIVVGIGVGWGNWVGLGALTVMAFIGVIYRIHVEESALLDDLGDRYRSFAAHRKRLVPGVW